MPYHATPMNTADEPLYTVAVRALCEFTARQGDLDLRFSPSPSAQEGIAGHARVAARRPPGYRTEIALSGQHGRLQVRGRADGFDPMQMQLEEIKTLRSDPARLSAAQRQLHWAQLRIYGWLMCQAQGLDTLKLALVYLNLDTDQESVEEQAWQAQALREFFVRQCEAFMAWADQEIAHRQARQRALAAMVFPHQHFRDGQRPLAEAVWRAATQGRPLLAQAPTGIGKTLGTLFPALKAMAAPGRAALDKLLFLTAKSSGRALALDALAQHLAAPGTPLRVLELVAKDKACEHPDKACHGQSCPLARGFFDRLPAARQAAVQLRHLDKTQVRRLALDHQVCPYHLTQDLLRWADVVVGDYHYYFDRHALLFAMTRAHEWRIGLLVDEAHNLVERARQMYSAELDTARLRQALHEAPAELRPALERLRRHWRTAIRQRPAYSVLEAAPQGLVRALEHATGRLAAWLAEHAPAPGAALQTFFFDALAFLERARTLDVHSLCDITQEGTHAGRPHWRIGIRNVVPAPFLRERWQAAHASVLFSATLQPWRYYLDLLGLPTQTVVRHIDSNFAPSQLEVRLLQGLSTRWAHRQASLPSIVAAMADQWQRQSGKYLAFFSSFDYLSQAADALAQAHPQLPQWRQRPRMDEASQQAFIERLRTGEPGIGFAVLGGAFAEGIDLPGEQLIGAFIATLGLPQLNPFNEEVRQRMQQLFGRGYEYAYLYPGLRKVVQAAGRVIRRPEDRGVLLLMDERFAQAQVRALLPPWWQLGLSDF